jgi:prefoldin subunit 5
MRSNPTHVVGAALRLRHSRSSRECLMNTGGLFLLCSLLVTIGVGVSGMLPRQGGSAADRLQQRVDELEEKIRQCEQREEHYQAEIDSAKRKIRWLELNAAMKTGARPWPKSSSDKSR